MGERMLLPVHTNSTATGQERLVGRGRRGCGIRAKSRV